jgi:hypothetical protein
MACAAHVRYAHDPPTNDGTANTQRAFEKPPCVTVAILQIKFVLRERAIVSTTSTKNVGVALVGTKRTRSLCERAALAGTKQTQIEIAQIAIDDERASVTQKVRIPVLISRPNTNDKKVIVIGVESVLTKPTTSIMSYLYLVAVQTGHPTSLLLAAIATITNTTNFLTSGQRAVDCSS